MNYYAVTAFNKDNNICHSVGIFYCTEDRIKEIVLWYYSNPQYNDGFTYFAYKKHEVLG